MPVTGLFQNLSSARQMKDEYQNLMKGFYFSSHEVA